MSAPYQPTVGGWIVGHLWLVVLLLLALSFFVRGRAERERRAQEDAMVQACIDAGRRDYECRALAIQTYRGRR